MANYSTIHAFQICAFVVNLLICDHLVNSPLIPYCSFTVSGHTFF